MDIFPFKDNIFWYTKQILVIYLSLLEFGFKIKCVIACILFKFYVYCKIKSRIWNENCFFIYYPQVVRPVAKIFNQVFDEKLMRIRWSLFGQEARGWVNVASSLLLSAENLPVLQGLVLNQFWSTEFKKWVTEIDFLCWPSGCRANLLEQNWVSWYLTIRLLWNDFSVIRA